MENPQKIWCPKPYKFPVENPDTFTVPGLISDLRENSYLADAMFFPNSFSLFPTQHNIREAIRDHKFIFIQAIRGAAKSFSVGRALAAESMTRKIKIVYAAPTYRQALHPWNYAVNTILENQDENLPLDLTNEVDGQVIRGMMLSRLKLKNGSQHVALPMGKGEGIRGERADVLVIDEFFAIERSMYKDHVLSFLKGHKGQGSYGPKLVVMTSAEYQDCFAYTVLQNFIKNIQGEDIKAQQDDNYKRKYIIIDINVNDLEKEGYTVDWDILEQQLDGASEEEKQQVLYNKWVGRSGQFLPGDLIERMSSNEINIEYKAEKGFTYGFSIDVATQLHGDYFVIHVWKFLPNEKMGLVYTYWNKGLSTDDAAWEIHKLNKSFNPEWIVMDKGGGGLQVTDSLMKPTLSLRDGTIHEIDTPILQHDEYRTISGQRKLILNRASDEMVRAGFANDRSRGGENIHSEDIMIHLMYDGLRKILSREECPILIPAVYQEDGGDGENSTAVIHDRIKDSVMQLKYLAMKTVKNAETGTQEIVKTTTNKMPKYIWKNAEHDAASALSYGYILYRIQHRWGSKAPQMVDAMAVPTIMDENYKFRGMIEIKPEEIYKAW